MTLLATSTSEKPNTVRVLFYGQSITVQKWWKEVERDLRARFPHANIVCKNLALGGFSSQRLVRTAEYDLYPFYPDLLIFHVYGHHVRYEDIIRRTRQCTTAEILIQTDHVTKPVEERWPKMMNYTYLPAYAKKYGCQLGRVRESWKRYLAEHKLEPKQLLRDGVHLNEHGEFLMAELVKQELVYRPDLPQDAWRDMVRTFEVGKDVQWQDGRLILEFEGNRVDLVAGDGKKAAVPILVDGKKPSAFPACTIHTRPSSTAGVGWPAIQCIGNEKPLLLEEWTVTCRGFNDTQDEFTFSVAGSKTGPDGEGNAKERFVSNSGRVVIEPEDWVFAYCRKVSNKRTPDGFTVHWKTRALYTDTYTPGKPGDATTVIQGIANTKHRLEIVGETAIRAVRVYRPPVPSAGQE